MALYDENGKITIDERAAQYDIRQMEIAIEAIEESQNALTEIIRQANETQGDVGVAIVEKAAEMKQKNIDMINRLKESVSFIRKTVAHYQWLDQQIKESVSSAEMPFGSSSGAGGGGGGGGHAF